MSKFSWFFLKLIYFLLKDNCFTEFYCFLSNYNRNQPQVYIYPLPFETPSHLPSHPPASALLGIYPEETKTERDTLIPLFIGALFTIARTWKQPRCPSINEWLKKLWYLYTMENFSAILQFYNNKEKWKHSICHGSMHTKKLKDFLKILCSKKK